MNSPEIGSFDQLPLDATLLRAVREMGFEKPSPIQAQALPVLLEGQTDFIGLAATGTGKTAAFSLPLLERIDVNVKGVQALILCPTRELSMQVCGQVNLLGKYKGIQALPVYGGAGYDEQLRGLRRGVPVVVGTPGRMIDHIERGTLKLDQVTTVVLDEADEMISMGFREAMETILAGIPRETSRRWLFSATMGSAVRKIADEFLEKPKMVQVNRTEMLSAGVEQYYYMTQEKNKPEVLCKLIDAAENFYGVIFCQTKQLVVNLTTYLTERGYKVDSLHGDMSQAARETAMLAFRQKRKTILVCTDVASRGLDVKDITHVINYSLPRELDNYVHRIGRTARSGKTGLAMSLVTPSHRHLLRKIENMTKSRFNEGTIPTRRAIGIKKIAQKLAEFTDVKNHERALDLMDQTWKDAVAQMTSEEVAARFLALHYPWIFTDTERLPQMPRAEHQEAAGDRPKFRRDRGDDGPPRREWRAEGPRREPRDEGPRGDRPRTDRPRMDRPRTSDGPRFGDRHEGPRREKREDGPRREWRAEGPRRDKPKRDDSRPDFSKKPFKPYAKFGKKKGTGAGMADAPPRRRPQS